MKTMIWPMKSLRTYSVATRWLDSLSEVFRRAFGKSAEKRREQLSQSEQVRKALLALRRRMRDWDGNE